MRPLILALILTLLCLLWPVSIAADQHHTEQHLDMVSRQSEERVIEMEVTAYTTSIQDCGKVDGITATGTRAGPGTIGSDWSVLPPGTRVEVPGYGMGTVEDRGDGARGNRLDVWLPSRDECFAWGRRRMKVRILP